MMAFWMAFIVAISGAHSQPGALLIAPPGWVYDFSRTQVLNFSDELAAPFQDLGKMQIGPKPRTLEYPISNFIEPYREQAMQSLTKFSSDPEKAKKIFDELAGYKLVIAFEFEADPNFKEAQATITPTSTQQAQNSSDMLSVTLEGKLQPRFKPTRINATLENPKLKSMIDPSLPEVVQLSRDPQSLIQIAPLVLSPDHPEAAQISNFIPTFQLPEVNGKIQIGVEQNFKEAAENSQAAPLRLLIKNLEANFDQIQLDPELADRLVQNFFKEQNMFDFLSAFLRTRFKDDAFKQLAKDAEHFLKNQKPKMTLWISRDGDHDYNFHLGPSGMSDETIAEFKKQGKVVFQAEAEFPLEGIHGFEFDATSGGATAKMKLPSSLQLKFVPSYFNITEEALKDFPDPVMREVFKNFTGRDLRQPGMALGFDLQLPNTRSKEGPPFIRQSPELSAQVPWKWNEQTKSYQVDFEHLRVQLPFLNRPLQSIDTLTFKASEISRPLILHPNQPRLLMTQSFDQLDAIYETVKVLGDEKAFENIAGALQSKMQSTIASIGNPKPLEVSMNGKSMNVQVLDFQFPNSQSIKVDWENKTRDRDHLKEAEYDGQVAYVGGYHHPIGYRELRDILPPAYERFKDAKVVGERWVTIQMPPSIKTRLENVVSKDGDKIGRIDLTIRSKDTNGPLVHLKARIVEDPKTKKRFIDIAKDNLASVMDSYELGSEKGDVVMQNIQPAGVAGFLSSALQGLGVATSGMGGGFLTYQVESFKEDFARDQLRLEIQSSRVAIYETLAQKIMEEMNGQIDSANIAEQSAGIFPQVQEGISQYFMELVRQIPRGDELQRLVQERITSTLETNVLQREGAMKEWPFFATQQFWDSQFAELQSTTKIWIQNAIKDNAPALKGAFQEVAEEYFPPIQTRVREKINEVAAQINSSKDLPAPAVPAPSIIDQAIVAIPEIRASIASQAMKFPEVTACILPNASSTIPQIQNILSAGGIAAGIYTDGVQRPLFNSDQAWTISPEYLQGMSNDRLHLFIQPSQINQVITDNLPKIRDILQDSIRYEQNASTGIKSKRFGVNETNHFEFLESPRLSVENGEIHLRTTFRDQQDLLGMKAIDTGPTRADFILNAEIETLYNSENKISGYQLRLKGKNISFESPAKIRPPFTSDFLSRAKIQAETLNLPLSMIADPKGLMLIPGMDIKPAGIQFFSDASGQSSGMIRVDIQTTSTVAAEKDFKIKATYDNEGNATLTRP
ncbi:MAG: hypothetical protein J0L93_07710 [Deltaproteobacteria bacterium]|nr:hypothetical protein [Deltaproteobacteria bacterium]